MLGVIVWKTQELTEIHPQTPYLLRFYSQVSLVVRVFHSPTWVCGRELRRSERKQGNDRPPAVTGARYKYFIPGEIGSQINSTRGHINDGVVNFLTVLKATVKCGQSG